MRAKIDRYIRVIRLAHRDCTVCDGRMKCREPLHRRLRTLTMLWADAAGIEREVVYAQAEEYEGRWDFS